MKMIHPMKLISQGIFLFMLSCGIAQPGKVVFQEDFEKESLNEVVNNWSREGYKNIEAMSLVEDFPEGSTGTHSLMMTYTPNIDEGGHLFKTFPEGYDSLFVRFYVKFLTRGSLHHFVKLGGYGDLTPYPKGGAGDRPKGDDSFVTGIEQAGGFWNWLFYSYWMNMRKSPSNKYWGNVFVSKEPKEIPKGEWICVEFMVKMNNPVTESNGEMAFWIDGEKILHVGKGFPNGLWTWGKFEEDPNGDPFEGFQWRSDEKLKINFFWLDFYVTKGDQKEMVLIDDIVASNSYIGPLK
tara:strand:- start:1769 stop:2650 length:882 start_codon:yes stop_codon:yes gene_type:complete